MGGSVFRQVVARMGADGWLGIGWPKEYGGQGRGPLEQFIFWDETYRARAPLPIIAVNTIGPTVMQLRHRRTEAARCLPGILRGELHFGVGYTEPSAGTDLASLTTRAVRDGDDWVINGQKIFTTHAHDADYIWLAARTDTEAPKHKGITIILVPTDVARLLGDADPHARRRAHQRHLLRRRAGARSRTRRPESTAAGADHLAAQPRAHHARDARRGRPRCSTRCGPGPTETPETPSGGRVIDEPWVQPNLARCLRQARRAEAPELALGVVDQAGVSGDGGSVRGEGDGHRVLRRVLPAVARDRRRRRARARGRARRACFGGFLEQAYRGATTLTFGGGVNEVQRDIIAMAGLGMPRPAPLIEEGDDTMSTDEQELERSSKTFVGRDAGPPSTAPDPVNEAMIRHWCEAMGDRNPGLHRRRRGRRVGARRDRRSTDDAAGVDPARHRDGGSRPPSCATSRPSSGACSASRLSRRWSRPTASRSYTRYLRPGDRIVDARRSSSRSPREGDRARHRLLHQHPRRLSRSERRRESAG